MEKELVNTQEFVQEFDETTGRAALTISEVFIDDKGLYRCVALNQHGQDETAAYVTVEDMEVLEKSELRQAPRITLPLQPQIVKTSSPLDLLAHYEAFPPPTVKWYHQGKELKPSRDYKIEQTEDETTLHIEEVYDDDSGDYEVKVFNEVGEARSVATVIVTRKSVLCFVQGKVYYVKIMNLKMRNKQLEINNLIRVVRKIKSSINIKRRFIKHFLISYMERFVILI